MAGAAGRMGRMLLQAVSDSDLDVALVAATVRPGSDLAGSDVSSLVGSISLGLALSDDLAAVLSDLDVLIDFTPPEAALVHAKLCGEQGVALVSGTTGFSPEQAQAFEAATEGVALCCSANFSTGVNLAYKLLAQAAASVEPTSCVRCRSCDRVQVEFPRRNWSDEAVSGMRIIHSEVRRQANAAACAAHR